MLALVCLSSSCSDGGSKSSRPAARDQDAAESPAADGGDRASEPSDAGTSPAERDAATAEDAQVRDAESERHDAAEPLVDAGRPTVPQFPPSEDADGDGLANELEMKLGTDLRYRDTDIDGIADDVEVGSNRDAAADADRDGVIDALENPAFDNDRDGLSDDADTREGWQVVYGRFVPAVVANGGGEPARFELKLAGAGAVEAVFAGMSARYHRAEWAPDELEIDGAKLGTGKLQLFDDGTRGDVIAGDHVYSRGGIATRMAIRSDRGRNNGKRCRVLFNEISVKAAGATVDLPVGITVAGMPPVVPDYGFWLPVIHQDLRQKVEPIAELGQRTSRVLNLVDPALSLSLEQLLLRGPGGDADRTAAEHAAASAITKRVLGALTTDADFIYAFSSGAVYGSRAGFYLGLGNDLQGIGRHVSPPPAAAGSKGRLRGLLAFRHATEFPLNHETMHSWGVELSPLIGTSDGHWGTAGTYGVLGGFDPATLMDLGNGTFRVGHFSESGNDWIRTPFSTLELYLMGLVPASEVSPIPVLDGATVVSNDATGVTVSATRRTVTIDDIVGARGARVPAVSDARKTFDAIFVLLSDRSLSAAELALIDHIAADYDRPIGVDAMSFEEATGGRATINLTLPE